MPSSKSSKDRPNIRLLEGRTKFLVEHSYFHTKHMFDLQQLQLHSQSFLAKFDKNNKIALQCDVNKQRKIAKINNTTLKNETKTTKTVIFLFFFRKKFTLKYEFLQSAWSPLSNNLDLY